MTAILFIIHYFINKLMGIKRGKNRERRPTTGAAVAAAARRPGAAPADLLCRASQGQAFQNVFTSYLFALIWFRIPLF